MPRRDSGLEVDCQSRQHNKGPQPYRRAMSPKSRADRFCIGTKPCNEHSAGPRRSPCQDLPVSG
jgi:hypothetical protein